MSLTKSRSWLLLGLSLFVASAQGRDYILTSRLNAKVDGEVRVSGSDLVHVLTQINARLRIPLGLVIIKDADVRAPFSYTWGDTSVRQVIDDVVAAYPAYTVRYEEDAVEIRPKKAIASVGRSILDLPVTGFVVQNEIVARVAQRLHRLAHDAYFPPRPILPNEGVAGSLGVGAGGNTRVSFSVETGTIRTALNALAAEAGQMWMLAYPAVPRIVNGYLETEYVNVDRGAQHSQQPVWGLFPVGIPIEVVGK